MDALAGSTGRPVALVTGSGRRLGAALAVAFARGGYDVAVHHHASTKGAESTAHGVVQAGGHAEIFAADLRDPHEIEQLFDDLGSRFGRLDCLVNSAAIFPLAPWPELTRQVWDEVLSVNLTAPFLCVKAAEPLLRASAGGHIVNLVDLGAFEAWVAHPACGVAKAGLLKLTQSLARSLGPEILVNAVAPGSVEIPDAPPAEALPSPKRLPLGRWATPDDVAEAILFLARTRYITGQCIVVDGGKLLL